MSRFDLHAVALRVLAENGFEAHSAAAEQAAQSLDAGVHTRADSAVRDLTHLSWSSIDNRESRDLDQIEVVEKLADGAVKVLIGIADVDALVRPGDAIDRHASTNTTSLYTGVEIFPMLPEHLSTNLTSLIYGEARLAIVTELVVAGDATIREGTVYRARVTNHAKLAYEDVAAWLEGKSPALERVDAAMEDQLRTQSDVAQRLRRARVAHGALNLETIEATPIAKDGEIVDVRVTEDSVARQLIEELMIAANGVVARWLESKNRSAIRRVVRTPKRWDRIVALAATYKTTLPNEPNALALSEFLDARHRADPAHFPDLSLSVIKLLGPGEYVLERAGADVSGHFGLAVHDYTHATAPNRRFVDLVIQRIVKAASTNASAPYTDDEIAKIGAHATEREHAAQKVERTMRKVGAALFLHDRIGQVFDGVVTGNTSSGVFVRITHPAAEGRIVRGERNLDVGDAVKVKLVATEPSKGFIDFAIG